ncbi:hypothetical protein BT93_B0563 [Corymbia citriodora subsp. variegata]|nr:hypothetical protein BT93_B0563 [Corymbia citriodora subsp. variegata]
MPVLPFYDLFRFSSYNGIKRLIDNKKENAKPPPPPLHSLPSLSLFLLFFFFFSGSFHGVHSTFSTICEPGSSSFVCGNVSIRYPFWKVSDAPLHCEYPGLGLICPDGSNHPTLSLPGHTYFVTDINYDEETLTLVDIDVADQRCPKAHHNLTIGSLPLGYNSADVNLTFFFNCNAPPWVPIPAAQAINCLGSGDNQSYVSVNMSQEEAAGIRKAWGCEEAVAAAVKQTEVMATNMVEGFVLDWAVAKECSACEHSSGRCAFNRAEHVQCYCKDGSTRSDGSTGKVKWLLYFVVNGHNRFSVPACFFSFSSF